MSDEIKEILDNMREYSVDGNLYFEISDEKAKLLYDYIINLQKQNNDLRKIYRNTYKKLYENGNDELARYFMAQIDACPTFYVEPVIDYYREYQRLEKLEEEHRKINGELREQLNDYKSRVEKATEYIETYVKDVFQTVPVVNTRGFDLEELLSILPGSDDF